MTSLIPGRECGDCNLCCIVPGIDRPEIQKAPSSTCRHCADSGCAIYTQRPDVCRNYHCGWRRLEMFDEEWRPDKSGVFAELEAGNHSPQFGKTIGINLILVGNPLKTIRQTRFCDMIIRSVRNNIPLLLGLPGPAGKQSAGLSLNTKEMAAAVGISREQVRLVLERTLKRLVAHDFVPFAIAHHGNDFST